MWKLENRHKKGMDTENTPVAVRACVVRGGEDGWKKGKQLAHLPHPWPRILLQPPACSLCPCAVWVFSLSSTYEGGHRETLQSLFQKVSKQTKEKKKKRARNSSERWARELEALFHGQTLCPAILCTRTTHITIKGEVRVHLILHN